MAVGTSLPWCVWRYAAYLVCYVLVATDATVNTSLLFS